MIIRTTVEQIFSRTNINDAIHHLESKKNSCGEDGVQLHEIDDYWKHNGDKVVNNIICNNFKPQVPREKIITMPNGKHRKIALISSVDRLILRAITQKLQSEIEKDFSENSYAYIKGTGVDSAIKKAAEYMGSGYEYVVELDINNYFEEIDYDVLLRQLKGIIVDIRLYNLIEKYITCTVESDYRLVKKKKGLLQGSPLSPLLSNLYLTEFDAWLESQGYAFVRFSDDINLYVKDMQEGFEAIERVRDKFKEYSLTLNEEKSGVYYAFSRRFLGYAFEKVGSSVIVKRYKKIR